MCWKCQEMDRVIVHYRELGSRVTDQATLEGIALLIQKMEAEKRALHPDEQSPLSLARRDEGSLASCGAFLF